MTYHAHLLEDRLFGCYLAERGGETIDPRLVEHLTDCPSCAARYTELATFMDALHAEGVAEADAVFDAERLRDQQRQIARRLELVGHQARVLSFPRRLVRGTMTSNSRKVAPRWLSAAAAATLVVAAAAGASYSYRALTGSPSGTTARAASSASRPVHVAADGRSPAQVAADAAFLSDLEMAMERPHTRELLAFDALTPHVRDVSLRR